MSHENILHEVVGMLHEAEMKPVPGTSDHTLLVLLRDDAGNKLSAEIRIHEHLPLLAVSALYPLAVPEERRAAVGEYVVRANRYEVEGGFDFDPDDGLLIYEYTTLYGEEGMTPDLLRHMIVTSVTILGRHLPALGLVIYANMTPVAALDTILRFPLIEVLGDANDEL